MYESFFNLTGKPFDLVPNPAYLYLSSAHRKALNYLTYGIKQQSGFLLLTGEVGTGKTTILRQLIKSQLTDVTLSKVFNTKISSQQLLEMVLDDFGVSTTAKDKPTLLRELNDFLIEQYAQGRQCLLIIDEAQNFTHELLEEVRLLSNLENDDHKLLRIILSGQPELKTLLAAPELLQLRQRIQVSCHISPLPKEEISDYIGFRLQTAGNREAAVFDEGAFEAIHRYTNGVPRLINILCDYLFLDAYANQTREITAATVHEVAADLNFNNQYWNGPQTVPGRVHDDTSDARVVAVPSRQPLEPTLPPPSPMPSGLGETAHLLADIQGALNTRLDAITLEMRRLADEVATLKRKTDLSIGLSQPLPLAAASVGASGQTLAGKVVTSLKNLNIRLRTIEESLPRLDFCECGSIGERETAIQNQLDAITQSLGSGFDTVWQAVEHLSQETQALHNRIETRMDREAASGMQPPARRSWHWMSWLIFWAW